MEPPAFQTYLVSVFEAPAELADSAGLLPDRPDQASQGEASSLYDPDHVRLLHL